LGAAMTDDERKQLFELMLKDALGLVHQNAVLGLVIVVMPKKGCELPLAAIGGIFGLAELDRAFSVVIQDLEERAGLRREPLEAPPPPPKETLH